MTTRTRCKDEVINFLKRNISCEAYSLLNVVGGIDYGYKDGKWTVEIVEEKVGDYIIEKAEKDLQLIADRIEARSSLKTIEEGDVIVYLDGRRERVTHVWGNDPDDTIQAGGGSASYYMGKGGYASYSGGLNSGLSFQQLELTNETSMEWFWFFSGDWSGASRGINFQCPVKVWKQIK